MTPPRPPSLKLWRTILLSVPKNSSDDDFRFCRPNSLCLRQNSLFRRNNCPLSVSTITNGYAPSAASLAASSWTKDEARACRLPRSFVLICLPTRRSKSMVARVTVPGCCRPIRGIYRPTYEPSKRRLTWPNGAVASIYNGTEPDQLRGPQHDAAWCDELASGNMPRRPGTSCSSALRTGNKPSSLHHHHAAPDRLCSRQIIKRSGHDRQPRLNIRQPRAFGTKISFGRHTQIRADAARPAGA